MLYAVRISLPDRPGSLGAIATSLSALGADIVSMWVVDREGDYAVDELCIEATGVLPAHLRDAIQGHQGVVVETVRRIERAPDPLAALELADELARGVRDAIPELVAGLPSALSSAWAMALTIEDGGRIRTLAATPDTPVPPTLETPWVPLSGARRLEYADWFPTRWRLSRFEIAAAPLGTPMSVVICGRWPGMRYRTSELRQLDLLARMAVRADRRLYASA